MTLEQLIARMAIELDASEQLTTGLRDALAALRKAQGTGRELPGLTDTPALREVRETAKQVPVAATVDDLSPVEQPKARKKPGPKPKPKPEPIEPGKPKRSKMVSHLCHKCNARTEWDPCHACGTKVPVITSLAGIAPDLRARGDGED